MGILGGTDVAAMLADLAAAGGGVAVTHGSTTTTGLRDEEAVELFGGEMPELIGIARVIQIASGSLPGLASGSAIAVDGTSYVVAQILPYGDGAMCRLALRNP